MENLTVTHDNLPSVVSKLFKKVSNIENMLLMQSEKSETQKNDLIPINEACEMLNLSKATIYSKCSRREIPYHKPKGTKKLFFSRSELLGYLSNGRIKTVDEVYQDASIILKNKEGIR